MHHGSALAGVRSALDIPGKQAEQTKISESLQAPHLFKPGGYMKTSPLSYTMIVILCYRHSLLNPPRLKAEKLFHKLNFVFLQVPARAIKRSTGALGQRPPQFLLTGRGDCHQGRAGARHRGMRRLQDHVPVRPVPTGGLSDQRVSRGRSAAELAAAEVTSKSHQSRSDKAIAVAAAAAGVQAGVPRPLL